MKARRNKGPETVSFRVPLQFRADLLRRASADQVSPGDFARKTPIAFLEDTHRERLEAELSDVTHEVQRLRGDLATIAEVLLVLVSGGSVSPTEAQVWVEERLRQAGREGR